MSGLSLLTLLLTGVITGEFPNPKIHTSEVISFQPFYDLRTRVWLDMEMVAEGIPRMTRTFSECFPIEMVKNWDIHTSFEDKAKKSLENVDRIETIDVNPIAFRLNMTPWGVDVNRGTINRDN